jgi:hypothetical protein
MSNIFGDGTDSSGNAATAYDLMQNTVFNQAITDLQNSIAGSTVNLNPIISRLDAIDIEQVTQNNNIATKLNTSTYNTDKAELTGWRGGVDDTFTQFFNEIGAIEAVDLTQNNRLTALENNVASGYVTNSQFYTYETTQQVINDSQDAKIDDIYSRLGGTGQTVDLGPINTAISDLQFSQSVQDGLIASKPSLGYVEDNIAILQGGINSKVSQIIYDAEHTSVINRLNTIDVDQLTQNTAIAGKLNISTYNTDKSAQTTLDNTQNSRLTTLETSMPANKITLSQPQYNNVQYYTTIQDLFNTDIQNLVDLHTARISILEDANTDPTIAISNVTNLQTNLTSLQSQINSNSTNLSAHINSNPSHAASSISNTPIANLTQTAFNVQNALQSMNARIDTVTVNSTGFTAYGNTFLQNFYTSANTLSIPNNMFMPNFVGNDAGAAAITGNRGSVLWGINQNLTRTSNVGFKTIRVGSRYAINDTAGTGSDANGTSWDFAIANTINPGSLAQNYYRLNPWRMEYVNPYSSATETIFSIRGPQFSGDTSSKMIVETNMILTDTSNTFSKTFTSIISDIALNTSTTSAISATVTSLNSTVTSNTNQINNNTNAINTLSVNITSLNNTVNTVSSVANNAIQSNSVASLYRLNCLDAVGASSDGNILNGAYFDSQGRIIQRTRTILDASGNIYGKRLLGGVSNTNEDSFRLFDYAGNLAFSANNNSFSGTNGVIFDSSRNINGNSVNCSELKQNGVERIDSGGRIILNDNVLNASKNRVVINTLGEISSPYLRLENNQFSGGFAFEAESSLGSYSYIKYDGSCRFGESLIVGNGISVRGDIVRTDAGTGSFIPISRNNQILNIPTLVDVNDVVLGYNNVIGGNWTSPFGGQRNVSICGAGNRTNGARSAIIGTNNVLENTLTSSFFVLGYGWNMNDIKRPISLTEQAGDFILLGNAQNENSANPLFVTIGGGMRMPSGAQGFSVYLANASSGVTDVLPAGPSLTFTRGVSAKKYKKEIEEIPTGTFKLDELKPVVYTLKDSGAREVGFVADDLMGTSWQPFVVQMNGEVEALNYQHMVTGLVDVIKQQQKLIDCIDEDNCNLEARVSRLEKIVNDLLKSA